MEKLSSAKAGMQRDKNGAIIGFGVFFLGIALLLLVFYLAYTQFSAPVGDSSIQINLEGGQMNIQSDLLAIIIKAVFLFVMGYCSSWIAGRGLQLYRASKSAREKE